MGLNRVKDWAVSIGPEKEIWSFCAAFQKRSAREGVLQKASLIGFCLLNEEKVVPWWGGWPDPVSAWSQHTKEAGFPLTVQTWIWFVHQRR